MKRLYHFPNGLLLIAMLLLPTQSLFADQVYLTGKVIDWKNSGIDSVSIELASYDLKTTTNDSGYFNLIGSINSTGFTHANKFTSSNDNYFAISIYTLSGRMISSLKPSKLDELQYAIANLHGVYLIKVKTGSIMTTAKYVTPGKSIRQFLKTILPSGALLKTQFTASTPIDTLVLSKTGYDTMKVSVVKHIDTLAPVFFDIVPSMEHAFFPTNDSIKTGYTKIMGQVIAVDYYAIDTVGVIYGDIVIPLSQIFNDSISALKKATTKQSWGRTDALWPCNKVPYYSPTIDNRIDSAVKYWESVTNLRFTNWQLENNYVRFVIDPVGQDCYSDGIGMQSNGPRIIHLGPKCNTGNAIHEIGHAIGLFHEHQRPDAWQYINIDYSHIQSAYLGNFKPILLPLDKNTWGDFDFGSIMMYPSCAFSTCGNFGFCDPICNTACATMLTKDGSIFCAQRNSLSQGDINAVNKLYSAPDAQVDFSDSIMFSPTDATHSWNSIFFKAWASCATIVTDWQWDFGDGSTGQGNTTVHAYANCGSHTVVLKAVAPTRTIIKQKDIVVPYFCFRCDLSYPGCYYFGITGYSSTRMDCTRLGFLSSGSTTCIYENISSLLGIAASNEDSCNGSRTSELARYMAPYAGCK